MAARRPGFNADTLYDWRGREREQTDCYTGGSCGRTEWRRSSGEEQSIAGTIKPDSAGYGNSSGDADFFRHRRRSCVLAVSAASSKPSRPWPLFGHVPGNGDQQAGVLPLLRRPERGWRSHLLMEWIYDECLQGDEENGCNYGIRRIIPWLKLHRCYADGDRRVYRICWKHRLIIQSKQHHPN